MQQGTASDQEVECGVFTVGNIPYSMETNLRRSCEVCSKKRGPSTSNEMEVTSPYRLLLHLICIIIIIATVHSKLIKTLANQICTGQLTSLSL